MKVRWLASGAQWHSLRCCCSLAGVDTFKNVNSNAAVQIFHEFRLDEVRRTVNAVHVRRGAAATGAHYEYGTAQRVYGRVCSSTSAFKHLRARSTLLGREQKGMRQSQVR